ncbi:hypothetical protein ACQEV4_01380 [Streptomyces shenzhenensis]|uniref:hypothetical protein n=1 Tax=Streptomyces shenzhenensis TaxID=943815 RepID=UPI003D8EE84D
MTTRPTPENTSVETATVQIRTLTVGAKQMTQGIFRQLIAQPIVSTTGRVGGTPWGIVNYHPDRCEDASEHLHVVWQNGNELRRAYVAAPERAYLKHPLVDEYVTALIFEGARDTAGHVNHGDLRVTETATREISATVMVRGVMFRGATIASALQTWEDPAGYGTYASRVPAAFEEAYSRPLRSSDEVVELLPVEAYRAAWRELSSLPQLFIGR